MGSKKEAQVTPLKEIKLNNLCLSLKDNTLHPYLCGVPAQASKNNLAFFFSGRGA